MEMLLTDWCAMSMGDEGIKNRHAFGQSAHLYTICKIIGANV